jgi:hypothetical protein
VAKTFYYFDTAFAKKDLLGLSPNYFAAHLPLYPVLIKSSAFLIGYLKSMLFWPVVFACLYGCFFYYFVQKLSLSKRPLLLTLVALFFTPRFLVARVVGAPETIFLFWLLVSVYFFLVKKYWWAGLFGALATLTKSPGILLFFAYFLFWFEHYLKTKKIQWQILGVFLIPFSLLGLFGFYYWRSGDFLAYFHSGDNIHLLFPPFQVFNAQANWVGTGWLEDIIFIYLFYGLVLFEFWQRESLRPIFYFVLVFFLSIISIQHKDIARYSLPMLPFGLIALERFFRSRGFLLVFGLLLPAIFFYAFNFILYNQAPITDWRTFL